MYNPIVRIVCSGAEVIEALGDVETVEYNVKINFVGH